MVDIGRLEPVEIRQLWKHEEYGFSTWLEKNLDSLAEVVGMPLRNPIREKAVGRFSLDLLAETEEGAQVIIENQLDVTDHGHLGKVLTYLANLEAKIAIWIAGEVREEHVETVRWLNEFTPADTAFFLVKLSAFRIAGSAAAPHFAILAGPSEIGRHVGLEKRELADRHVQRRKFWQALLERARSKGILTHAQRSPSTDSWLSAGAGIMSGVSFNYNIWMDGAAVDLWIQSEDPTANKALFDALQAKKQQLEQAYGGPLEWDRLDGKRASRVRGKLDCAGLEESEDQWPGIQDQMIDAMDRLARSVKATLGR